jgi:polar amino acid transport system substrate-binding protein
VGSRARVARTSAAVALALAALTLCACTQPAATQQTSPKVSPPTVREAGVLRAGVDLSYPPFAGVDKGRDAGIDIDVASAFAAQLGLRVEFVDVKASQIATAISDGDVDVAMSAPFSADVLSRATIAGTYLSDGPALFASDASASVNASAPLDALDGAKLGAQRNSEAYWRLADEFGAAGVVPYDTLRAAMDALGQGEVDYVGGDALVGAYIARDYDGVHYVVAIAPAHLLGVAVAADNTKLADAVGRSLDSLAADGALDEIRASWVGALPKLPLTSVEASAGATTTTSTP